MQHKKCRDIDDNHVNFHLFQPKSIDVPINVGRSILESSLRAKVPTSPATPEWTLVIGGNSGRKVDRAARGIHTKAEQSK